MAKPPRSGDVKDTGENPKRTRFDPKTGKSRLKAEALKPKSRTGRVLILVAAATVAALTGVAFAGSSNMQRRGPK